MKIKVTQRDISLANKRRNIGYKFPSRNCPVALAMKRLTKRSWIVGQLVAHERGRAVDLPEIAVRNIEKWDSLKRMYPFTFEI
jgi:hypothetical protein